VSLDTYVFALLGFVINASIKNSYNHILHSFISFIIYKTCMPPFLIQDQYSIFKWVCVQFLIKIIYGTICCFVGTADVLEVMRGAF